MFRTAESTAWADPRQDACIEPKEIAVDSNRRVFLFQVIAGGAVAASNGAHAQQKVDPKDPQAAALGYVENTTQADKKKFPKHANDQKCNGCQLYSGAASAKEGPCAVFGGKLVAAEGWCNSWVKKA
ncbi:high-potential iron-sulfur protein [Ramlibacter algicola]|uniref:High-potential iron-sulfur protein n=1 Tax=Ramlibacter algicola TaxID=2795217 RepID=A0A934PZW8_9BURK|nr:high-potential iron-sulfur protein [Ramlibacter algicola]MBK0392206.1 high-potential iron-sulfur protein [Ramlibacter algicola]